MPITDRTTLPLSAERERVFAAGGRLGPPAAKTGWVSRCDGCRRDSDCRRLTIMEIISLIYHNAIEAGANKSSGIQWPDAALYKLEVGVFDQHMRAIARVRELNCIRQQQSRLLSRLTV